MHQLKATFLTATRFIMKTLLIPFLLLCSTALFAAEAKEVTLEGTGMCGKCELGVTAGCNSVLKTTDAAGEELTYFFTNNLKHGEYFCQGTTENLVVKGTVTQDGDKLMVTATSVDKKEG